MKRVLIALFLVVAQLPVFAAAGDTVSVAKVQEIAAQIKSAYAPDARDDIFDVKIDDGERLALSVETTLPETVDKLKAALAAQNIPAVIKENLLPDASVAGLTYGVANLSVVNNRLVPRNQAELVTQTLLGTPVRILKRAQGNYLVRTPDNYLSWAPSSGITAMNKADFEEWAKSRKVVYIKEFGHSYSEPSETSMRVSDLVHGVILRSAGVEKGFNKVIYPDKRIGYIPLDNVMDYDQWVSRPDPVAAQILAVGKSMLGVPYLWGGTSIKGVDCSGFTKTCYYLNGIVLPRDASQQAKAGDDVDVFENDTVSIAKCLKNLKAGDLLFFGGKRPGREPSVTHTGIYMGDGVFIHSSGLVKINSMVPGAENYSDLVVNGLVRAKRMLSSIGRSKVIRLDNHPYYSSSLADQ